MTELLKKELPSVLNKSEYIENIADLASIRYCKKVVHQLAMKYVTENVNKINNLLKNTHIKEDDILYKNEDSFQAYYNTVVILDSLTYKDDLIASYVRLLRRRHIKLSLGNPEYPVEIRKIIYTTNAIEGLNRQFRKVTKTFFKMMTV